MGKTCFPYSNPTHSRSPFFPTWSEDVVSRVALTPMKMKAIRKGVGAGGEKEAGP